MILNRMCKKRSGVLFALLMACTTASVNASVKYVFAVTEQPPTEFHQPFSAELIISDAAFSAGEAMDVDIESLLITAGTAIRHDNPMTLSLMHTAFVNWSVTLSEDRQTVTAISATITPHMSLIDYWVLYQPRPPHPDLSVHENLAYVSSDYVNFETTLLPVPPSYHNSAFQGEWRREFICRPCRILEEWVICFPFCMWPWVIILVVIRMMHGLRIVH